MRARTIVTLAALSVTLLAGCTGAGDADTGGAAAAEADADKGGATDAAPATDDAGTARTAQDVMAEQSTSTPHGGGDAWGGEVTIALRAVEVAGSTMTVRWTTGWSDDEAPDDAGASYYDMGLEPVTTVTDRENLKAYRPFCTEGAWQPDTVDGPDAAVAQQACRASMTVSPLENIFFKFPNHGTVESWAVLPAPEGQPEKVDVAPVEGLPMFTDATVTYLDGAQ